MRGKIPPRLPSAGWVTSTGLKQIGKEEPWEIFAEQHQIEHHGEYPDDHILCKVLTVVNLSETAGFDQASDHG